MFTRLRLLFVAASAAFSQTFTGSIVGVVSDSSGASVPRATVSARNQSTAETRSAQASEIGQYVLSALPPGVYDLTAGFTGFKQYRRESIRVDVLQNVRIDVTLEPGSITETISVAAESPLLETENAALGQVIDNRRLVDLPLNGRNTMALLVTTTGISSGPGFGGQPVLDNVYAPGNFAVNSGLQTQSETLLDGVPNNVFLWSVPAFVPSVDAVQEFKVQTNNFAAEFGHTSGGIVNLTTKPGTNRFTGSVYEFLRNGVFDANTFFANRSGQARPAFTYNQFGFALGGPVRAPRYDGRNRTFFFVNYEGFRQRQGRTILATVPQEPQRQGDFSQTRNAANQAIQIFDPLTVRATPGVGSGNTRDPFPGNRIPLNRFDPAASRAVSLWALPNQPGTGGAQINNFVGTPSLGNSQNQFNMRIDQIFNANHRTFGRYSRNRMIPGETDLFGTAPGARPINPFQFATAMPIGAHSFALDHTWLIGPSILANFRYGFTRQTQFRDPASLGVDLTTMGFSRTFNNGVQIRTLPSYAPAGYDAVGEGGNIYFRRGDNVHSWHSSLTKTLSRHNLKGGFEFRAFLFNDTRAPDASGTFNFNAAFTQADPLRAAATSGHSFASFLLGHPASGSVQFFPAVSLNQDYYGLYFQDDFRVTSSLTLNLGLRWDLETPKTERFNRLSTFDRDVRHPFSDRAGLDLRGGLRFLGVDGVSRGQWVTDRNNFAPRFGLAWRITPRFVARGGYGIFFQQTVGQGGLIGNGNDGFGSTSIMVTSRDGGITSANRLTDPFPEGLPLPSGSSLGLLTRVGESLVEWNNVFNTGYTQHFNFSLQREFTGLFLVDAAYVGTRSVGIPINTALNQLRPEALALGAQTLTQAPNPFAGLITTGPLLAPQVSRGRLLRPYPHFDNINFFTPTGQAGYNSLQVKVERRFKGQFGFLTAYTFAKALTDAGGTGIFGFYAPATQNNYARSLEKSLSPIDISNRLVFSFNWELPFGQGKPLLSGTHRIVNKLVSGWQFNGIASFQKGTPLGLTTQVNQTNAFGGQSRPNIAQGASAKLDDPTIDRWFNTSVFSQPAPFTFGNVSRTLPDTRAPGFRNIDLSLFKNTRVTERVNIQLRLEAFNAENRVRFSNPGQVFGNPQFGVISNTHAARVAQIAAKILF